MMMSADGDDQADQQHELADPSMAEPCHAVLEMPWQQPCSRHALWYTQPMEVEDCKSVGDVVIATEPEHNTGRSIKHRHVQLLMYMDHLSTDPAAYSKGSSDFQLLHYFHTSLPYTSL